VAFDATLESSPGEAPGHDNIRETVDDAERVLAGLGYETVRIPVVSPRSVARAVRAARPDVVVNLVEGLRGDADGEGRVARALARTGVPFTGCDGEALELALDKARAKERLAGWGLPVPRGVVMERPRAAEGLAFPLMVKCLREDASLGIGDASVVRSAAELERQVRAVVRTFRQPALVEEYLEGREFNVAVVGPRPTVLPVSEIDFSGLPPGKPRIVSYAAKWASGSEEDRGTVPQCPADLPAPAAARIRGLALRAFRVCGLRDYARIDIRTDAAGKPFILEVNPNPDLSPDAGLARSARAHGWPWEDLLGRLVLWAWRRKDHRACRDVAAAASAD
jgi:D-alanine-D-alanine ligase